MDKKSPKGDFFVMIELMIRVIIKIKGVIMKNFYLIYGMDKGFIQKKVTEIVEKLNLKNIVKYSLEDTEIDVIIEDAQTVSLFDSQKILILENASIFSALGDTKKSERLLEYIEHFNSSTYIIFTLETEKIDNRKKITKKIETLGKIIEVKKIEEKDVRTYVKNKIIDHGCMIEEKTLDYLVSLLGNDYDNLENEVEKLLLLEKKEITKEDVSDLIIPNMEEDIFELLESIVHQDKTKSIQLYNSFVERNEDMIRIIYLLASKYRFMLQVRLFSEKGYMESEIASILKIHPYRVKMTLKDAYQYEEEKLIQIIQNLAYLDRDIKLGRIDKNFGLEMFLLKI